MLFLLIPFLLLPVALIMFFNPFNINYRDSAQAVYRFTEETYRYLTDGEVYIGQRYSMLRHSRPFVVYQGVKTTISVSVFGDEPLPERQRVFLQKRGYRTGLFGWTIGGLLGGSKLPGIEVTPVKDSPFSSLSPSEKAQYEKDVQRLFVPSGSKHKHLETMIVHIPVASGDGYFRLRITSEKPRDTIAVSPVFRVGSVTWASANPQGATWIGLAPELVIRSAFITARTAAWTTFYALFPFLKLSQWLPGMLGQRAIRAAYGYLGIPELDEKYRVSETYKKANERMYRTIPFGAVGVRSAIDLQRDEEAGRQGVAYKLYA